MFTLLSDDVILGIIRHQLVYTRGRR